MKTNRVDIGRFFISFRRFKRQGTKNRFQITKFKTKYVLNALSFWFFKFKITIGIFK